MKRPKQAGGRSIFLHQSNVLNLSKTLRLITALLASANLVAPASADDLQDGFENPPQSARPRVWWHWMNGNVTIDGIEKDIDWMARIGIGGLQNFDVNLATPQIVPKRLVFMEPDWKAAFKHAVKRADEKGLEFAIAASPGWSETGGPWVKPEDGMKKLVWSETIVPGGKRFSGKIEPAPTVTGPYQTVAFHDPLGGPEKHNSHLPVYSGDVAVLAVPVTATALPLPIAQTSDGKAVDVKALNDADLQTSVAIPKRTGDAAGSLLLTYGKPVTIRSATIFVPKAKPPFGDPQFLPVLEAEQTGGWSKVAELPLTEVAGTASFPAVTAQKFRVVLYPNTVKTPGLGAPAPGAEMFDIFGKADSATLDIGDLRLSSESRIDKAETKAGFALTNDFHAVAGDSVAAGIAKDRLINLTGLVRADGILNWTPPKGNDWRVYRFGWSLTGKMNHPATPEATGLEVDKYDAAAVRRYLETYLGMYRNAVGPDWIGAKGIRALLTDSIEVGTSNWTPGMLEEFKARRGYDALTWMPALAGEVISSPAETEKFLYDFRRTLGELLADAHYGTVAKVAHEAGLTVYGEALENGRPVLGDDLAMRSHADVPMAAMWTFGRGDAPRPSLLGDMKGAASVAHVYGQNIVAAESMTSAFSPWAFAPSDLKRIIDLEFAYGINRPVIHTSVHQPVDDKKPGLSLLIFGQYFNRHESWAEMAKPWVDYISRSSFMLQQGRNYADIAYFYGEEAPVTGLFEFGVPAGLPTQYAYDFVNADILTKQLRAENGELVANSGAHYKALYLGGSSKKMTLATLKRIVALADAGVTVVGEVPLASPSLNDDQTVFSDMVERLKSSARFVNSKDAEAVLGKLGVGPDFAYAKPQSDSEILFVHRKLADGDLYFLNNRKNRSENIEARLRVTGKRPELWRAIDGKVSQVSYRMEGPDTIIPLNFGPEDALFVVFRKRTNVASASVLPTKLKSAVLLSQPWLVAFEPNRGAPASISMPTLTPLEQHVDKGVKYFSGTATYTTSFTAPKQAKAGAPVWIDLGKVGDVAEIRVNGQMAGTLWFAPNRLDIGKLIKKGTNKLEVRVANLWVNRLIGDKQPGAVKMTFTAAPTYKPDAPLRPSGLIGPVTIEY